MQYLQYLQYLQRCADEISLYFQYFRSWAQPILPIILMLSLLKQCFHFCNFFLPFFLGAFPILFPDSCSVNCKFVKEFNATGKNPDMLSDHVKTIDIQGSRVDNPLALSWLKKSVKHCTGLGSEGSIYKTPGLQYTKSWRQTKYVLNTVVFKYFTAGTVKSITGEVFSNVLKQKHPTFQILFIEGAFISVWAAGWQCAWWIKGLSLYGSMTQFRIDRTILLCLDMLINCQLILLN